MTLSFGLLIAPTPRDGTLQQMQEANDRRLQAAVEHDLSVWFVDHFQSADRPFLECLAHLAHTAGRYPSLTLGTLVIGQSYRNPALLAKSAATLQFLTDGKFILGLGAGWKEDEYAAYGFPFPPAPVRIAQLDESLQIIKGLWAGGPFTFRGDYYSVTDAYCEPTPDPDIPIMVGGGGERLTLRVAAKHADLWNVDYQSPETFARKLAILRDHCQAVGREPSSIVPTSFNIVSLSRDPDRVLREPPANFPPGAHIISGTPDEVVDQLRGYASIGVQQMQLNFLDFPASEGVDLFVHDVLPAFSRAAKGNAA